MSALLIDEASAGLQTVGISTTAIITYAIPDNSILYFDAIVLGQTGAGLMQTAVSRGNAVKRWAGGSAAFVNGSPVAFTTQIDASFGASNVPTITVSGNNLLINVVQSQGGTYNWRAALQAFALWTP